MPQATALHAVGIDEWAWRRGHCYGTILVNLADHRVVELCCRAARPQTAAAAAIRPGAGPVRPLPDTRRWREIQALGYTRSARTVCRFITRLRRASERGYAPEVEASPSTRPQGPSARAVSFVMMCAAAHRVDDAQRYLDQLCQMDALVAQVHGLSQAFCPWPGSAAVPTWRPGWPRPCPVGSRSSTGSHKGCREIDCGNRGAHPAVEQWPRGRADHPTEAPQAPRLRTRGQPALTTTHQARCLEAAGDGRP